MASSPGASIGFVAASAELHHLPQTRPPRLGGDVVRRRDVLAGQADDQRHQQLGLTGAGAAGHHAVYAVLLGFQPQRAQTIARGDAEGGA